MEFMSVREGLLRDTPVGLNVSLIPPRHTFLSSINRTIIDWNFILINSSITTRALIRGIRVAPLDDSKGFVRIDETMSNLSLALTSPARGQ